MTAYTVNFERIGRRHDLPPRTFEADDADQLAARIHRFAGRHLGSREYAVSVDLEAMTGSIEAGRFGTFTIARVAS